MNEVYHLRSKGERAEQPKGEKHRNFWAGHNQENDG